MKTNPNIEHISSVIARIETELARAQPYAALPDPYTLDAIIADTFPVHEVCDSRVDKGEHEWYVEFHSDERGDCVFSQCLRCGITGVE